MKRPLRKKKTREEYEEQIARLEKRFAPEIPWSQLPLSRRETLDPDRVVVRAAMAWWNGLCPKPYTLRDHIRDPTVMCKTAAERRLATALAKRLVSTYYPDVK